jgi:alpha-beta hydrolase superfamily lysophospholipase
MNAVPSCPVRPGSRSIAAGSADKTWCLYPESRHELFDDLDRGAVMADLGAWLEAHGR